jgi:hypothetical protein
MSSRFLTFALCGFFQIFRPECTTYKIEGLTFRFSRALQEKEHYRMFDTYLMETGA